MMIYLDYNATTPIDPAVAEAMRPFIYEEYGNPSSSHALGRAAKGGLENARNWLGVLIGASADEITFTSGGTEASNWAIRGVAKRLASKGKGKHFVTTAVEHWATIEPMKALEGEGFTRTEVGVDGSGMVAPEEVRKAIRPDTILISVMHAQNEVGTIEPIAEIGKIARDAGVLFHVDAAQSIGKIRVDVDEMGADLLSVAGHKLYAPKGIGALYIRDGVELEPLIYGASQESGRRGGTENVIMAVGLGKAAELAVEHLQAVKVSGDPVTQLRDALWEALKREFGERVLLNGHATQRLPSTLSVSFPGYVGEEILAKMGGVCAGLGAACHPGGTEPSAVLTAMGVDVVQAAGTIRFSLGRPTTRDEIERVVEMMARAVQ